MVKFCTAHYFCILVKFYTTVKRFEGGAEILAHHYCGQFLYNGETVGRWGGNFGKCGLYIDGIPYDSGGGVRVLRVPI